MTVYIANVNGDWWQYDPTHPIYVLDTDKLTPSQLNDIMDEYGELEGDKFEYVIQEYGKQVTPNV